MNSIQKALLRQLKSFHKLCEENNIVYFVVGGTQLGAIRHNGFIPWDDDIDVAVPRSDYEKLATSGNSFCDEKHKIKCQQTEPGCPISFIRYELLNSTCIEEYRDNTGFSSGIYIDIFPIDGIPHNKILQIFRIIEVRILKMIFYCCVTSNYKKRNVFKRGIIIFCKKHLSREKIENKIHSILKGYQINTNQNVANLIGSNKYYEMKREIMPYEIYFPQKKYKFEDTYIYGVNKPNKYLEMLYGKNYMNMPPKEERKGKHNITLFKENNSNLFN